MGTLASTARLTHQRKTLGRKTKMAPRGDKAPAPRPEETPLSDIQHQIALGEYAVDPDVLAGEIIWKTQLIRKVRKDLMAEDRAAGRSLRSRTRRFRRAARHPIRMLQGRS